MCDAKMTQPPGAALPASKAEGAFLALAAGDALGLAPRIAKEGS